MMVWMGNVGGDFTQGDWSLEDPVAGLRVVIRPVKFPQAMPKVPAVIAGFTTIDTHRDKNARVRVTVENVTTTGFNARFITWSDSITYGLAASWIAITA